MFKADPQLQRPQALTMRCLPTLAGVLLLQALFMDSALSVAVCAEMTVTKHDCNWCTCLGGKVICTEISCPTFTTKKVTHDPDRVRDLFNIS
ncbi:hypothetical protein C0J52_16540 [Blattella germanica]|nr:hypothetical protein C0J52_16540 [Blattella germanica]